MDSAPNLTDDLGSWAALVGILLPLAAAYIQKLSWGDEVKTNMVNGAIFAAAVVATSFVYALIKFDPWSWDHWQGTLLAIIVWGIATYKTFWKPSGHVDALRAKGPVK